MGGPGVARFDTRYLLRNAWIDGHFIFSPPVQAAPDTPGIRAMPTHGGTHKLQRRYRGDDKPKNYSCYTFTFTILANDESSWDGIREAESKGAPIYYSYGSRRTDTFALGVGGTGKLTRPRALDVVTGVTEDDFPTIIKVGGTVDEDGATFSGRTVTAAAAGTFAITYTPVHLVIFRQGLPEDVSGHNRVDSQVVLEEVLVP